MSAKRLTAVTLTAAALVLGACGGSDDNDDKGNKDGEKTSLRINAATGLSLVQLPDSSEGAVTGTVLVTDKDGNPVTDAVVTLNGVTLPAHIILPGFYDATAQTIPDTGPGQSLTLTASAGGESATLVLPCPAEVTLTSPAEGSTVSLNQMLTLSWTGKIDYNLIIPTAHAGIYDYDTQDNLVVEFADEESTGSPVGSSIQLKVPDTAAYGGFVAQLSVPGAFTDVKGSAGYCSLIRRAHLVVAE